jgi:hypothetical protein
MMLLVTGPRDFKDELLVIQAMDNINALARVELVLTGGATGVDTFAARWAWSKKVDIAVRFPRWDLLGKRAGPERNGQMIRQMLMFQSQGNAIKVLAVDRGTVGTSDCIRQAQAAGLSVDTI